MVQDDLDFVKRILASRLVEGSVLELGAGYGGETCRAEVQSRGLKYYGTDLQSSPGVDFSANFENIDDLAIFNSTRPFGAVFVLNVLEHVFDPIRILDNAITLLRSGGVLVVVAPAIWPLHNYPMDCWRLLPDFWSEYARRRGLFILDDWFQYIGVGPVNSFRNIDGTLAFPPPCSRKIRYSYGRIVHKLFNTFGRSMAYPIHIGIGVVMRTSC